MAVVEVACPGCQATLKAREGMAGKKARCMKCGLTFRLPGEKRDPESADDGQFLSAIDTPATVPAANPFDFTAPAPEAPPLKKSDSVARRPAPISKPTPKPTPAPDLPPPKPAAKSALLPKPKSRVQPSPLNEKPAADPLSLGDDESVPAVKPAASRDPFAFGTDPAAPTLPAQKEKAPVETTAKGRKVEPKSAPKSGYRARSSGGVGKLILGVVVFGLVVGGVVGGVLMYLDAKKGTESASADKKDEKKAPDPAAPAEPSPKAAEPAPKDAAKTPVGKNPGKAAKNAAFAARALALPAGPPIQFAPLAAKPGLIDKPTTALTLQPVLPPKADAAFPLVRRVFPPLKRDLDAAVLWQAEAGFQGRGEKLLLGVYSPQTGKEVNKVVVEGDGQPDPACDLSVSADVFAHAHRVDGKVSVFDTRTGAKVIDGFAPYADMKGKDYKLAAVFLTQPPDALVTVSTTGAVHAWKVPTKEPLGEYVPPKPAARPLVPGKSVVPGPGKQSVVLVAGGAVYAVAVAPAVGGTVAADLGGDAGRSLALAASGGGRMIYAFETDADGKKEKAVLEVREDGKHVVYKWPDKDAGEPVVAGWAGDDLAMVGTDRGAAVWFEAEGTTFRPLALARTPGDMARHVAADGHWALLPDPADPKKCVLLEFARPQQGLVNPLERTAKPVTVRLDDKGLHK